jgi:hypothetical protein
VIVIYVLQVLLPLALVFWMAFLPPRNLAGFWLLSLAVALSLIAGVVALAGIFPSLLT